MTELHATTPGLFPLPDWAKRSLEDLKGHQKHDLISGDEGEDIVAVYEEGRSEVIEDQQSAAIDLPVEGQLRWDDMLAHPLAVCDAVETRGIVRYYDNNNFYRETVVTDELAATGDVAAELEAASDDTDSLNAVLPGPYSLADLAEDEYYGNVSEFQAAIAAFLAEEAAELPDVDVLTLPEPSLVTNPPEPDRLAAVTEALDTVAGAIDAEVVVWPFWGALEGDVYEAVRDSAVDVVGFDLVTAPDASAALAAEHGTTDDVALGVVDGQNTLVEDPDAIQEAVTSFCSAADVDPDAAYIGPNTELFYLPTNRATEKLAALGAASEVTL